MGMEEESMEFSTLGGWIARRAKGLKHSRYGDSAVAKGVNLLFLEYVKRLWCGITHFFYMINYCFLKPVTYLAFRLEMQCSTFFNHLIR